MPIIVRTNSDPVLFIESQYYLCFVDWNNDTNTQNLVPLSLFELFEKKKVNVGFGSCKLF